MTATFLFWGIAVTSGLAIFAAIFAPMLRGARSAEPRARYDAKIFRDQLREIEADKVRGLITEAQARATEIEISRRLLASAEADAPAPSAAPPPVSRRAAAGCVVVLLAASVAGYAWLGAPGLGDQPLGPRLERLAAERARRPDQAEVETAIARQAAPAGPRMPAASAGATSEAPPPNGPRIGSAGVAPAGDDVALIDQLKDVLRSRPDDEKGHRLLARTLTGMGDWAGARMAQAEVIRILGVRATADDYAEWAELMILATNGYVSPEAEAALGQALARDPANKLARYYSGLLLLQEGRPDLTYRLWNTLLAEGPESAPWVATIRAQIGDVARMAGLPPPAGAGAGSGVGPSAADVQAAEEMNPEARRSMITGMVDQLAARLGAEGGPVEDWVRLIRAQGVLGRVADAQSSWDAAKTAYAADPEALATLAEAARSAGLTAQ